MPQAATGKKVEKAARKMTYVRGKSSSSKRTWSFSYLFWLTVVSCRSCGCMHQPRRKLHWQGWVSSELGFGKSRMLCFEEVSRCKELL